MPIFWNPWIVLTSAWMKFMLDAWSPQTSQVTHAENQAPVEISNEVAHVERALEESKSRLAEDLSAFLDDAEPSPDPEAENSTKAPIRFQRFPRTNRRRPRRLGY